MRTFVDTSALYAMLDENDANHGRAARWMSGPGRDLERTLITHSYVVVESAALVKRRLGTAAVRALLDALVPALATVYVDEPLHHAAVIGFRGAANRKASFVDWVSFQLMREASIEEAFAFDSDFRAQGFRLVA